MESRLTLRVKAKKAVSKAAKSNLIGWQPKAAITKLYVLPCTILFLASKLKLIKSLNHN